MTEFEFLAYLMKATAEAEKKKNMKKISVPDGTVSELQKPSEQPEKIDIKLTFIGGGEIVIPYEQWDDYRYNGKFFSIVKNGADIAWYNAEKVFSLVLVRQGDE